MLDGPYKNSIATSSRRCGQIARPNTPVDCELRGDRIVGQVMSSDTR